MVDDIVSKQNLLIKPKQNLDTFEEDQLGREPLALALEQLVRTTTQPFVLAIDSPWGTGKTTFLNMFKSHLTKAGCPVIYFNAWESDFTQDPLSAFFGEIEGFVDELKSNGRGVKRLSKQVADIKKFGKGLIYNVVPLALSMATRGAIDRLDIDLGSFNLESEDFSNLAQSLANDCIVNYRKNKESLSFFKDSLSRFSEQIRQQHGGEFPLVIVVDELDRCRPDYAIALLERIKHLFDVENVIFILAMDMMALSSAVSRIYGDQIRNDGYLLRFFDYKINLPKPDHYVYSKYLFNLYNLYEAVGRWTDPESHGFGLRICYVFGALCESYQLSLRQQNRVMTVINLVLRTVETGAEYYHHYRAYESHYSGIMIPLVVGFFKFMGDDLYDAILSGKGDTLAEFRLVASRNTDEYIGDTQALLEAFIKVYCQKIVQGSGFRSWCQSYFSGSHNQESIWERKVGRYEASFASALEYYPPQYFKSIRNNIDLIWQDPWKA